jgi:hypothetical protein
MKKYSDFYQIILVKKQLYESKLGQVKLLFVKNCTYLVFI